MSVFLIDNSFTDELKHAFNLSKPKIIFTSKVALKNVIQASSSLPYIQKIILINSEDLQISNLNYFLENFSKNEFNVYENAKKSVNIREKSTIIFLSSGTTGKPKGEMFF